MSLSANRLVAEELPGQAELLVDIVDHGVMPHSLFFRDGAGARRPDIRSYTGALLDGPEGQSIPPLRGHAARLVHHAGNLGLDLTVEQIGTVETLPRDRDEAIQRIEEAGKDSRYHGLLVFAPLEKLSGESDAEHRAFIDRVTAAIPPKKDIDFVNPFFATLNGNRPLPPTPRAGIDMLEAHGLLDEGLVYTLQGPLGKVGGPMALELRRRYGEGWYKRMVHEIERHNSGEFPDKIAESDVVIAAAGAWRSLTVKALRQAGRAGRLKAILAVGLNDFEPGAREVADEFGIQTTPRHLDGKELGWGAATASRAWDNTLRNAAKAAGIVVPRMAAVAN